MSPRTQKQYEIIREEKRSLIMDTALEHFAEDGYHITTISHIAKHAGISKGLMYNYFSSKEELLSEIIKRSIKDIYSNLDQDRDGILTADEFESFVRQLALLLREKRKLWMLLFQMMMQNEVREVFIREFHSAVSLIRPEKGINDLQFIFNVSKLFKDYFERKKSYREAGYDPEAELSMFLMTMKGFAVTWIYTEFNDEQLFNKMVEQIISAYK